MEFEEHQLRRVLAAANEEPTEQKIVALAGRLRPLGQLHVSRQFERIQVPHKKDLLKAVIQIRNSADTVLQTLDEAGDPLKLMLSAFKPLDEIDRQIKAVRFLRNDAEQARYYLEFEDARHGRQKIETDLYLDLFDLYRDLTGKTGKGDETGEGPLYRFVKACVTLIDPDLELPSPNAFRVRLIKADNRRHEEVTRKDELKIDSPDLRL
jgi:hypothetical protein